MIKLIASPAPILIKSLPNSTRLKARSFHLASTNLMLNQLVDTRAKIKQSDHYFKDIHIVNQVYSESGAINNIPKWYKLGIFKLVLTFTCFLLVGAQISKTGVKILEENDIFKPEDENDDDEDD